MSTCFRHAFLPFRDVCLIWEGAPVVWSRARALALPFAALDGRLYGLLGASLLVEAVIRVISLVGAVAEGSMLLVYVRRKISRGQKPSHSDFFQLFPHNLCHLSRLIDGDFTFTLAKGALAGSITRSYSHRPK